MDITQHPLVLEGLVGSKLKGLATEASDTDYYHVRLLPARAYLGLNSGRGPVQGAHSIEGDVDILTSDLPHYVRMLLDQNPRALDLLWSPDVKVHNEHVQLLVDRRRELLGADRYRAVLLGMGNRSIALAAKRPETMPKEARNVAMGLISAQHAWRTGEHLVDFRSWRDHLEAFSADASIASMKECLEATRVVTEGEPVFQRTVSNVHVRKVDWMIQDAQLDAGK